MCRLSKWTHDALGKTGTGKAGTWLAGATLCLFLVVLLRNAWVTEDAYIGLRTVDNLVNGHGLTWNTAERVQAYTCPLWILLLSAVYFFTREAYFTSIFLPVAVSLLAVSLMSRAARSWANALLGAAILLFSKAFIDFSVSGLENPLTHLLLAAFFAIFLCAKVSPRTLFLLALIAALGVVNRLDSALLYGPALAWAFLQVRCWKNFGLLAAGFLPLLAWEGFSLFYYGFLFPNTAYAKLGTGLDRWDSVGQGFYYLRNSLRVDPLTLLSTGAAVLAALISGQSRQKFAAAGIVLYLFYVVLAGGDFMSGRFLTAPLMVAVLLLVRVDFGTRWLTQVNAVACVVVLGLLSPHAPIRSGADYGTDRSLVEADSDHGISDERGCFFAQTGFLNAGRNGGEPRHAWVDQGRDARRRGLKVVIKGNVGIFGYYAGPDVYIVDPGALTDPLLARLPAAQRPHWRVGHFARKIPDGYFDFLHDGDSRLADQRLALYLDKLSLVTRGNLFDRQRLAEIWNVNVGRYDDLIDRPFYQATPCVQCSLVDLPCQPAADRLLYFSHSGLEVDLGAHALTPRLEISLDNDDHYEIVYLKGEEVAARQTIRPGALPSQVGLAVYALDVPAEALRKQCNRIRIVPIPGWNDAACCVGHLRLASHLETNNRQERHGVSAPVFGDHRRAYAAPLTDFIPGASFWGE